MALRKVMRFMADHDRAPSRRNHLDMHLVDIARAMLAMTRLDRNTAGRQPTVEFLQLRDALSNVRGQCRRRLHVVEHDLQRRFCKSGLGRNGTPHAKSNCDSNRRGPQGVPQTGARAAMEPQLMFIVYLTWINCLKRHESHKTAGIAKAWSLPSHFLGSACQRAWAAALRVRSRAIPLLHPWKAFRRSARPYLSSGDRSC